MLSRETLFQAIIVVGALLLASSTLSKRWFYAEWVKIAFWIVFAAALIDVALALFLPMSLFRMPYFGASAREEHLRRYRRWDRRAILVEWRSTSRISSLA